jgi:hypothetical protein
MADTRLEACTEAIQLISDNTDNSKHKCTNCSVLERGLKDVLEELSSLQLIVKLLCEESTQDMRNSERGNIHHIITAFRKIK